jgi:hypothetical protein
LTSMFTGGSAPEIAFCPQTGTIIRSARIGTEIWVSIQNPGDATPGLEFIAQWNNAGILEDLPGGEGSFSMSYALDGPRRLLLVLEDTGVVKHYYSVDDGRSFTEIV